MSQNQQFMSKKELEEIFISIQQRFNEQDMLIKQSFDEQDKKLSLILNIVQINDQERKEIKSSLWEHDRRIQKLEKCLANN